MTPHTHDAGDDSTYTLFMYEHSYQKSETTGNIFHLQSSLNIPVARLI
jgi:hypothetical protein